MSQPTLLGPVAHGAARDPLERHYTPRKLARAVCSWLALEGLVRPGSNVLEMHAGGGSFIRAARDTFHHCSIGAMDIDAGAAGLELADPGRVFVGDALSREALDLWRGWPDVVIGNPPFSNAVEHVEAALALEPTDVVAFLLPMGVLEAERGWPEFLYRHSCRVVPVRGRHFGRHCRCVGLFLWQPWLIGGPGSSVRVDTVRITP